MANAFGVYFNTKFKREIVVDSEHCQNLIKRSGINLEEIAFTIHIPIRTTTQLEQYKANNIG